MAMNRPSLLTEIGPDGLAREAPVIAYTEKLIAEEQLHLRKYIEENYSKIRDVERELTNLSLEMKLTAGPKKAALELLRKKIETATEKIRVAKLNEEHARKVWEAASQAVKDEEALKQKLCEDLNNLVQESSNTQFSRLEELKRRLEAMNLGRASTSVPQDMPSITPAQITTAIDTSLISRTTEPNRGFHNNISNQGNATTAPVLNENNQQSSIVEGDGRGRKKSQSQGRGKGLGATLKGRGPGWTGSGFDVDSRT